MLDELQAHLLIARLPMEYREAFWAAPESWLEKSTAACLVFNTLGVGWPLPCLARGWNQGEWFNHPWFGAS